MNCKPTNFKGTEGAVGLTRWFEKMESIFHISNCAEENKVKYATCTLMDGALTRWNSYVQSVGIVQAYQLSWADLKIRMTNEYCPRNEIKRMETEFWNLTTKGNDLKGYTNRFHELALLCPSLVTPEFKRIERYIWGLPVQIQGGVTSSKPADIQSAIDMAHDLMDQVNRREAPEGNTMVNDNKRKYEYNIGRESRSNQNRRTDGARAYSAGYNSGGYAGSQPKCNKCNRHHYGDCTRVCIRCECTGHTARDCTAPHPANRPRNPLKCYECNEVGHTKKDCPKLKPTGRVTRSQTRNNNNDNARGRAYVMNTGEAQQDPDDDTTLLNP